MMLIIDEFVLVPICIICIPISRKHKMLFMSSWLIRPVRHQWCILINWTLYPLYWAYSFRLTSIFFLTNYNISVSHQTDHSECNCVRAMLKIHEACYAKGIEFEIPLWLILHFIYILHIYCIQMRVKGSFSFFVDRGKLAHLYRH